MSIFLSTGLPLEGMPIDERKRLVVQSQNFYLLNYTLYHKGADGIWRRIVRRFKKERILLKAHCGIVGGHYEGETTARKSRIVGYGGQL